MRCWRCGLPSVAIRRRSSSEIGEQRRTACMRLPACCHTTDCGPSITSAVTSSPRCAGRQCRNTADSAAAFISAASIVQPANARRRSVGFLFLPHRRPHVGVDRVGVAHRVVRVAGELDRAAEIAGPIDHDGVELVAGRRGDDELDARERGRERERRGDVVAVADVREAASLERRRTSSRNVRRSASAWHGWAASESRLTTGMSTRRAIRSSERRARTRAPRSRGTCSRACARRLRRSRAVDADLLVAEVDRVAAERRDRDLDRDAGAGRRLLEERGHALPGEHAAAPRRARPSTRRRGRGCAPAGGIEVVDLEEVAASCLHRGAAPSRGSRPLRRSPSSVTSSDGASRSALGVTALTIKPDVQAPLRDVLGVDPVARARPRAQAEAAHRDDAGDLLQRRREPRRRPVRRARGPAPVP